MNPLETRLKMCSKEIKLFHNMKALFYKTFPHANNISLTSYPSIHPFFAIC